MQAMRICLTALVIGLGRVAFGAPILDQSQLDFGSGAFVQGNISIAQTFTPSISGHLADLDLFMSNHDPGEGKPLIVSMYNTQNGVPKSLLGTDVLNNIGGDYAWYALDFSSSDIYLQANTLYAFVLSAPGTFYGIYPGGSAGDSYSRGMALEQNGIGASWEPDTRAPDLVFQTFMTVPDSADASVLLLSATFLILFGSYQRNWKMA
jgi:hypothetical protein